MGVFLIRSRRTQKARSFPHARGGGSISSKPDTRSRHFRRPRVQVFLSFRYRPWRLARFSFLGYRFSRTRLFSFPPCFFAPKMIFLLRKILNKNQKTSVGGALPPLTRRRSRSLWSRALLLPALSRESPTSPARAFSARAVAVCVQKKSAILPNSPSKTAHFGV